MKIIPLLNFISNTFNECRAVFKRKNHDYANEDALDNFKRVAKVCEIWKVDVTKPQGVALFMKILKIDRKQNLVQKGVVPKNESLHDTDIDELNYKLIEMAIENEKNTP